MNDKKTAVKKVIKTKPLLPTLRERKRYVGFQVISEKRFTEPEVSKKILEITKEFFGTYLLAKAGIIILKNKYDEKDQTGIIKISHKYVDQLKTSLGLVTKIKDHDAMIRTTTTSGILKKALQRQPKK